MIFLNFPALPLSPPGSVFVLITESAEEDSVCRHASRRESTCNRSSLGRSIVVHKSVLSGRLLSAHASSTRPSSGDYCRGPQDCPNLVSPHHDSPTLR